MELNTQSYLRRIGSLDNLQEKLAIRVCEHPSLPIVILNYNQLETPKLDPISMECRGLCLEKDTWNVVAKSFNRFFNVGEAFEETQRFNWEKSVATEKVDGSLTLLYYYKDAWRVNTRGSFALDLCGESKRTWEELFFNCLDDISLEYLDPNYTYVCEYVGPWNKVVRTYYQSQVFLLSKFHNITLEEKPTWQDEDLIKLYDQIGFKHPDIIMVGEGLFDDFYKWVHQHKEATYEGIVLRDETGLRVKLKNPRYVSLHHLKGNGNGFSVKALLPHILAETGEKSEILTYFPEVKEKYEALVTQVNYEYKKLEYLWDSYKHLESQKEFALSIVGKSPFSGLLFTARKTKKSLKETWDVSHDFILKVLDQ